MISTSSSRTIFTKSQRCLHKSISPLSTCIPLALTSLARCLLVYTASCPKLTRAYSRGCLFVAFPHFSDRRCTRASSSLTSLLHLVCRRAWRVSVCAARGASFGETRIASISAHGSALVHARQGLATEPSQQVATPLLVSPYPCCFVGSCPGPSWPLRTAEQ